MRLKKEDRMLLDCLRDNSDFVPCEDATTDDWNRLVGHSIKHSVAQMVYRRLKNARTPSPVPSRVLERLRGIYLRTADRNIRFYNELSRVLGLLNDANIPAIVLKGAHLGEVVYGNLAMRAMVDVDLLFKREDLARAQETLKAAGYLSESPPLILDIHLDFDRDISIDMETVWEDGRTVEIAGQNALVLSPENLILHLCLHLAYRHMFKDTALRMICDIRETLRFYGDRIKWDRVLERSRKWRLDRSVYASLYMVSELTGTVLPDDILDSLKTTSSPDGKLKTWALERIFGQDDEVFLSRYFWRILSGGSMNERLAGLKELVFPSAEYLSHQYDVNYGSFRNYFYYLSRVRMFFAKYVRTAWKILIRDEQTLVRAEKEKTNVTMRKWMLGEK